MTDHKFTDDDVIKALDICDKFDFFYGQRAGRELWFEKPVEVQNEDIRNFADGIAFVKDFINRQKAEIEQKRERVVDLLFQVDELKAENEEQHQAIINALKRMGEIRAEAYKEFAERVKENLTGWETDPTDEEIEYTIDTLVKEMTEENK